MGAVSAITVSDEELNPEKHNPTANWGPMLFYAAIVASFVFFWWLVIYDHGVTPLHGG
ncbi:MAG: hypothetical protein OET44_15595 [Gammaproteobacteria bacterium]|nr:hypothetical protein [Gammaproteobacteria bacterium]